MKRLSYEPLIVHLFKIFKGALKSKSDRSETKMPTTILKDLPGVYRDKGRVHRAGINEPI